MKETIQEAAANLWLDPTQNLASKMSFITGAKYMGEKLYSEQDMIEFGEWMKILPLTVSGFVIKDTNIVIKTTKELLKYWFENFKKK